MRTIDANTGEILGQTELTIIKQSPTLIIEQLERARYALVEAKTLGDVRAVRDYAETLRYLTKEAEMGLGAQNEAAEIKLRAERLLGQMLDSLDLKPGRPEKTGHDVQINNNVKLSDLDISYHQSKRWQKAAEIPDEQFEEYIRETKEADKELTSAGMLRIAGRIRREHRRQQEAQTIIEIEKELPPTDHEHCYYKDEWTQVWHGAAQDLFFVDNDSVDLIVTSPPYNIGPKTGNGRILWHGVDYAEHGDKKPEEEYQAEQIAALNELWRVTRPGGSLFYNHKIRNRDGRGIHPLSWLLKTDWNFRQQIIWDRGSTHNHEMTYFWPVDELVFWLTKGTEGVYLSQEGAEMTTVWRFNFEINTDHPAPFPEQLASRCIRAASKPGDLVLDPFGGSMTTCFVAKKLKRLSIGVDISKQYVVKYAYRCSQGVLL